MTKRLALLSLTLLPAFVLPAGGSVAQETGSQRFQMEKTESGFVRLDRETGAISVCREEAGELICRMAADERAAYEKELDLLAGRVTALEERLDAAPTAKALPDEAEIEQSLSIMERFIRRFMEIIEEFTAEQESGQAAPDRT